MFSRGPAFLLIAPISILSGPLVSAPREVYVVPFSHLDLFWAGTREECLSRGNRIIAKATRLAAEHPQFRFLIEDEDFLANYVETHQASPALAQLKRLVKEGRIEISPKWAAILQNLPRGETWVRNFVYGKRYAREVFGVDPIVANLGDLPGYSSQLPQIAAKAGVPFIVMTRMGPSDKSLFHYRALNGSKVLTWNTIKGYGWGTFLTSRRLTDEQKRERFEKDIAEVGGTTGGPILMHWGTDLWAPDDDLIPTIEKFKASARLIFATPSKFFSEAERTPAIPEASGEIPHAWGNILSSIVHLWPPTIAATDMLLSAEKFAAINYALGYAGYPQQEFEALWKKVLEASDHNNFGQGGDAGDLRKLEYARLPALRGEQILRDMLRNIAERVRSPFPRAMPVVVFNPLSWSRDDVVRAHVSLYGDVAPGEIDDYKKGVRLVDETGDALPFYVEQFSGTVSRSLEIAFVAREVPSLGYKTYFLVPSDAPPTFPNAATVRLDEEETRPKRVLGADEFENEFYRVALDRATGGLTVYDKDLGRVVAKDLEIVGSEERGGDTLSKEFGSGRTVINSIGRVEIEENSPVRFVVRIPGDLGGVPLLQRLSLYRGLKRVDLENTVEWKGGRLIKIEQRFCYEHPNAEVYYGVPFGAVSASSLMPGSGPRSGDEIDKELWKQWRQIQDWIFAGTSEWGLTIAADHQVVTVAPGIIRAGMLRGSFSSVGITRHDKPFLRQMPPPGRYVFRYSLSSGLGDWRAARSYRAGMSLNNALLPVSPADELSLKTIPPTQSFCALEESNLVVTALKNSERDDGLVLRVHDAAGEPAETVVNLLGQKRRFREVNLLEENRDSVEAEVLRVAPFEIKTVKLARPSR